MIVTLGVNGFGRMKSQLMQILNTKSCFCTNFLWVIYMCYQCKLICEYMKLVSIITWTVFLSSFWKGGSSAFSSRGSTQVHKLKPFSGYLGLTKTRATWNPHQLVLHRPTRSPGEIPYLFSFHWCWCSRSMVTF